MNNSNTKKKDELLGKWRLRVLFIFPSCPKYSLNSLFITRFTESISLPDIPRHIQKIFCIFNIFVPLKNRFNPCSCLTNTSCLLFCQNTRSNPSSRLWRGRWALCNVHHHWISPPHCRLSPPLSLLRGEGGPGKRIVFNPSLPSFSPANEINFKSLKVQFYFKSLTLRGKFLEILQIYILCCL